MPGTSILVLNKEQILQKTKRIAYEILENNFDEKEIVIAGIENTGYLFAQILKKELEKISSITYKLLKIGLSKENFRDPIIVDIPLHEIKKSSVIILVDDVLNSGKTLTYSLKPFLDIDTKKIQVAVLVDRDHKLYPVSADYIGYSLSTTLKEHITVILDDRTTFGVYLN